MRILTTFLLFIVAASEVYSQNILVDRQRLEKGFKNPDTAFVDYLRKVGYEYQKEESDSTLYYLNQSIKYAKILKYVNGELNSRAYLGRYFLERGDYAQAMQLFMENEVMARKAKDNHFLFIAYREISRIYRYIDDSKTSKEYLDKMLVMFSTGLVPDTGFYPITVNYNKGEYYNYNRQYDSAIHSFEKVFRYGKAENMPVWVALGSWGLGGAFRFLDQADSSLFYYRIAEALSPGIQRYDVYRESIDGISVLLFQRGKVDSAIYYATRAYRLSMQYADLSEIQNSSDILSKIYASQKQFDSAFKYSNLSRQYSDSLYGRTSINRLQAIAASNQIREIRSRQELEQARQQYRSNIRTYMLLAGLFILVIIIFFILRVSRQQARSKKQIEQAYEELKSTQAQLIQSEKMASLGELTAGIAHEIQNPLNFVNNFSEVNKEMIIELKNEIDKGNFDEVKIIANDIEANEEKIIHHGKRADTIVKGMLQHSRTSSGEKEPTDINALCDEYVKLAYHGLRAKDKSFNAKFETNFDNSIQKINVVPQDIGRVILNLINNAFYAVNERQKAERLTQ
ncbi:MAG TPA: histidine kinase dimerization/phospho-acceptor domain-containing protein, partial [Chitinophagaceae bacterium]|nr:histidine kinase dimerization/phospho-acceptor domain-containing protein [Chitinophagaceae bacterium]